MSNYLDTIDHRIKAYYQILEPDFPAWLNDYINTPELLSQQHISMTCGTIYSKMYDSQLFYSSLDHSIAVALIVWHFTHDRKQTLAGLFHDIATPAFKHCVDFLNGDYLTQESTEALTSDIIKHSSAITALLKRDNIAISEVDNYHLYPIADNDTPQLSADRLEYSLSNALFSYNLLDITTTKNIYNDIIVSTNETGEPELAFQTKKLARQFVKITSQLSIFYRDDRTRYSMQFIADILKKLQSQNLISLEDLYKLKESEIIHIIESSEYGPAFQKWRNAKHIKTSANPPKNVYYVHLSTKIRYIDPLCQGQRISKSCQIANRMIQNNLAYKMDNYLYLDLNI